MLPGLASPGRTASVSRPSAVYSRVTMAGSSGRGPTSDISPRSTFQSWGSSSTFTARSHAPNGNTRGSRGPVMRLESERRRRCIVRSLNMMNGRRSRPTRSARYRTGPAGEPPFGAAGGGVGVHRFDARLGGPGGDGHGLEQDLVIAVDVAAVLAVDDLRLHLPDDALEWCDDLGEGEGVEPLVRKAER